MQTKHTHDPWIIHYLILFIVLFFMLMLPYAGRSQDPVPNTMGYSTTLNENGTVSIRSSLSPAFLGLNGEDEVFRDADHLQQGVLFTLYKNDQLHETKGALLSNDGTFNYAFQTDTLDTSRYRIETGFYHDINCLSTSDDILTCINASYHNSTGDINARRITNSYSDHIFCDIHANCVADTPTLTFHSLVWARDLPDHEYAEEANTCPGLSTLNCNSYSEGYVEWVLLKDGVIIATETSHTIVLNGYRWDGTITVPAVPGSYQMRLQFNYSRPSGFLNLGPTVTAFHDHYSETFEITNPQGFCCQDKIITTTINASATDHEQAPVSIVALNIISGGANASYHAGTVVEMEPGFHASSGSYFHAYIESCTGNFSKTFPVRKEIKTAWTGTNLQGFRRNDPAESTGNTDEIETAVYPNPSTGTFHVFVNTDRAKSIRVYNILGNIVAEQDNTTNRNISIDIANHAKGIYWIQIRYDDQLKTEKLIHQ